MTQRLRAACWLAIGIVGAAWITIQYEVRLVLPGFMLRQVVLDLGLKTASPRLAKGFTIDQALYVHGMIAYNRERETEITLPELPPQRYFLRFKAKFFAADQSLTLFFNDHQLGTVVPVRVGAAQKATFFVEPWMITSGPHRLQGRHQGPEIPVLYELVEVRNFRATTGAEIASLCYDGPWITETVRNTLRTPSWVAWSLSFWIVSYLGFLGLVLVVLRRGLALAWSQIVKVALAVLGVSVIVQSLWYVGTLVTPYTIRLSPGWFRGTALMPVLIALLISGVMWGGHVIRWFVQRAFPRFWAVLREEIWKEQGAIRRGWMATTIRVIRRMRTVTYVARRMLGQWFLRNLGRQGVLLFTGLYAIGGVCLILKWQMAAKVIVDWAYGFLGVALMGRVWQAVVLWRSRARDA